MNSGFSQQGIVRRGNHDDRRLPRIWSSRTYRLAPENVLSADIAKASTEVREAYRFAIR